MLLLKQSLCFLCSSRWCPHTWALPLFQWLSYLSQFVPKSAEFYAVFFQLLGLASVSAYTFSTRKAYIHKVHLQYVGSFPWLCINPCFPSCANHSITLGSPNPLSSSSSFCLPLFLLHLPQYIHCLCFDCSCSYSFLS